MAKTMRIRLARKIVKNRTGYSFGKRKKALMRLGYRVMEWSIQLEKLPDGSLCQKK